MFTLFIRTIVVYLLVFAVVRLMGKRQISDMQPFDLVITLLIADLASVPMSDSATPLLYGVIPILGLFILHRVVAHFALKSDRVRTLMCGKPLLIISQGIVVEDAMRAANYTLNDLTEQLRVKDVFSISKVEYAILETNGSLSVLLKGEHQQPDCKQLSLDAPSARPSVILVSDGRICDSALKDVGHTRDWLYTRLNRMGYRSERECLFVCLDDDGMLHAQDMQRPNKRAEAHFLHTEGA